MGIGDWGLGIGDWGLGPIPNPQSPIPNPQSPIPIVKFLYTYLKNINKTHINYKNYLINNNNFISYLTYKIKMTSKISTQNKSKKVQEIKSIEVESDNTNNSSENSDINKIFVLINKNTEKLMNSTNKTDLIQCALEYNSYLIQNLIKEKDKLNKLEYDAALNRLYNNLSILTENFETYEDKYRIINIKKKENKETNKNSNKNVNDNNDINNTDRIYCNSITNIEMELPL